MTIKPGDLVKVLPARSGYYIVVEESPGPAHETDLFQGQQRWWLQNLNDPAKRGPMYEQYIEVVSESR